MQQAEKDRNEVREIVDRLGDGLVKTHMLKALAELDAMIAAEATPSPEDNLVTRIRQGNMRVTRAQDALALAVHFLMLEGGFVTPGAPSDDAWCVPSNWDMNAAEGIYVFTYTIGTRPTLQFKLKALYIGTTLAVHITNDQDKTSSVELSAEVYIRDLALTNVNPADVLQNVPKLRQQWCSFLVSVAPPENDPVDLRVRRTPPPPPATSLQEPSMGYPGIPSVGQGDVFPDFGMGGGRDSGMLVGPNHPIFGGPPSFPGTVPGARFDPFGPVHPRPMQPFPNRPRPAPHMPFGGPDPDHLRMPGNRNPDTEHMFF
ncbi:hypothetical protein ACHHYP_20044 [Achlya hypogyna]|uniref:PI31 proteasome regulator N-terminal domain-containing protein n=1 Tax=Achlya hypogyna TaxID=1202772 RepID=A0A1V9ZA21_ACHHY|nr:hypothetical protein ACHHYP_20044 [Achlya hypogyna]